MNNKTRVRATWLACGLAALLPWAALAHHSFAMYDQKKLLTLSGTVETWLWANPHCGMTLVVPAAAAEQRWVLAGQSVSMMERNGMHGSDIKVGDRITVAFHPALDGSQKGYYQSITVASGRTFSDPSFPAPGEKPRDVLANPLEAPPQ